MNSKSLQSISFSMVNVMALRHVGEPYKLKEIPDSQQAGTRCGNLYEPLLNLSFPCHFREGGSELTGKALYFYYNNVAFRHVGKLKALALWPGPDHATGLWSHVCSEPQQCKFQEEMYNRKRVQIRNYNVEKVKEISQVPNLQYSFHFLGTLS